MQNNKTLTRRNFLKIIAVAGGAGLAVKFGLDRADQPHSVSETRLLMGTIVNLTIVGVDQRAAEEAIATCLDRMAGLESVLSRFLPQSQLSILNREGRLDNADPALVHLIEESQALSELTGGAFDITVKPLLDLYQNSDILPTAAEIEAARQRVGYHQIRVDGAEIAFSQPGMAITLDGIAKGFIVDAGIEELRSRGLENVLVEAGGDLMARGQKSELDAWKIGLQSPRPETSKSVAAFHVRDQAVATSGDYFQHFSADLLNHHIINPRTGISSAYLASATVFAPTCLLADAVATALMVLPPEDGLDLLEKLDRVEGYLIAKDLSEVRSPGFK